VMLSVVAMSRWETHHQASLWQDCDRTGAGQLQVSCAHACTHPCDQIAGRRGAQKDHKLTVDAVGDECEYILPNVVDCKFQQIRPQRQTGGVTHLQLHLLSD
jgi:hypothetical protein